MIPVYKECLSVNEQASLTQAVRKFEKYDVFFIAPDGLMVDFKSKKKIYYQYFEKEWFQSVDSYSELMLRTEFYECFNNYLYVLIYQLDAFIFGNNIHDFIEMGFDYIGAPTLEGMYKPYRAEKVLYTQNGGFSLRKVNSFICWTKNNYDEIELMKKYDAEDSIIYALRSKGLNIAPIEIALKFSFDSNARECFQRNHKTLPLGCHAWERYDFEFWKPFIESQGYSIEKPDPSRIIIKDYYAIKKYNDSWQKKYSSNTVWEILGKLLETFSDEVYVWGMGRHGYDALQLLLGAGINIVSYLDTNIEKIHEGMYPCRAITVEQALMENKNIPIIVAMYHHVDACVILEEQGLHHHKNYITYMELFEAFEIETMKR